MTDTNKTANTKLNTRQDTHIINISASVAVNDDIINECYSLTMLQNVLTTTLEFIHQQQQNGLALPYFSQLTDIKNTQETNLETNLWQSKPKELDIYLTDTIEGRALNLEARGKDYATNILSYPSEIPAFILQQMPAIPLGELVICHDVVVSQATEQHKTVSDHVTHLLVHGILHLLGFDHELGQAEQDEMEGFEIKILHTLNINNPYE